jgi:hypothetical protein
MNSQLKIFRIVAVFTFMLLTCFALSVSAQQTNPNNLPPCPKAQAARYHNCFGIFSLNGNQYVGDFKNDEKNGHGTYTFADGDKYTGEFKDGKYHGQGTFNFSNGDKYVGEYIDGKMQGHGSLIFANGDKYEGEHKDGKYHGQGTYTHASGEKYVGEFKDGKRNGQGTFTWTDGNTYVGEFKEGNKNGLGIMTLTDGSWHYGEYQNNVPQGQGIRFHSSSGKREEGIWENDKFIRKAKVNLPNINNNIATNTDRTDIERERQQLAEERRRLEEDKRQREQKRQSQRVNLQVTHTQPATDGSFTINLQTGTDTASLQVNGEEQGGRADGNYVIKKVARAGQETKFTITATDINGNSDTKTITVSRAIVESKPLVAALNPSQVKKQPERDAVAIIIGIAKYESLPAAEFANDDARAFYDYAIRGLGVKPENIKLLVDEGAREAEILKTFRTWLPTRTKSTTDVYVFYSGHGLPTPDGNGLYLLPLQADREVIDDTAIPFAKINDLINFSKPKSVTVILDACYSGQTKAGQTLVASARPVTLKPQTSMFPANFTVISASQSDQISSSSPDLQHGIFSYFLMKGMEGDADANRDGKITLGEMRDYLIENVGRQAAMMSRKQEPQLIGDSGQILVGR